MRSWQESGKQLLRANSLLVDIKIRTPRDEIPGRFLLLVQRQLSKNLRVGVIYLGSDVRVIVIWVHQLTVVC